jgi:tetratricopeptide (TPR) repeat protein
VASGAEAQIALGEAELKAGHAEAAAAAFGEALRLSDAHAGAHSGLGRAYLALSDLANAEASLRRSIELVSNSAVASFALAEVYARTGRREEAFEQYRHAADLDPRNPMPLVRAAELALERQRDVLAAGFLDRVLAQQANHATALALYGDVMLARSDREQARSYYERALAGAGPIDRARVEQALSGLRPSSTRRRPTR